MPVPETADDMSRALRFLVGWGERLKDEGPLTRDEACRIAVAWRRDAASNGIAENLLVAAAGRPLPEHLLAMFGERHGPRADPVPSGGFRAGDYVPPRDPAAAPRAATPPPAGRAARMSPPALAAAFAAGAVLTALVVARQPTPPPPAARAVTVAAAAPYRRAPQPAAMASAKYPIVQLGAFTSMARAEAGWRDAVAALPRIAAMPHVVTPFVRGSSRLFRLRIAGDGTGTICAALAAHGRACAVVG